MKAASSLKVIIVGAGIGGLTCAIACRREGLEVVVLERASRIVPMGAGMQIPPNGVKVARQLGFLEKLRQVATTIKAVELRRYDNGKQLGEVTEEQCRKEYGDPWMAVHRADFHHALWRTCQELGVSLDLNMEVERIDFENGTVYMEDGDEISGDVIIGADGMGPQSVCRAQLLDTPSPLIDTGDVAYRAVLPLEYLKALNDSRVDNLCAQNKVITWLGPSQHAVLYSVRGGREFNLILIRSDHGEPGDLPHQGGDAGEMRDYFAGWDGILTKIMSLVSRVQKWKICTPSKVDPACRGCFAILGDAFHSNLPYQAQGAAMAMEDGAFLGKILGLATEYVLSGREDALDAEPSGTQLRNKHKGDVDLKKLVPAVLERYGAVRGTRASDAVRGEGRTEPVRKWFHLPDGPEQEARNAALSHNDARDRSAWRDDCLSLLGYDVVQEAEKVTAAVLEVR
ncbi:salicylate hydroxylase [Colletotrichum higginsianum]|uniref:Salicylate hydroxylase n=1 Tax=Colletotrichum higginsianum (strain IMI 349063) TaxID=759273 RepID=H1UYW2_COLHI|nr:salicylate hydroxylase [Colletotrichum higginsianum]